MSDLCVVWGNCQAPPLADLLRAPLAARGVRVEDVPPVYLADRNDLDRIHALLPRTAVLVTQPVTDTYRVSGAGSEQLVRRLPPAARVVRIPVIYDVGPFPFQVRGYTGDGVRIDAPITDYHDLRMLRAAERGWTVGRTLRCWPTPDPAAIAAVSRASLLELRRREAGLDVVASDLLHAPDALWTMTHPSNRTLADLARRVLAVLGVDAPVHVPDREFLGQRRSPVDDVTARALGWVQPGRPGWTVDGAAVSANELAEQQLSFYAERPDVVVATLRRAESRLGLLSL